MPRGKKNVSEEVVEEVKEEVVSTESTEEISSIEEVTSVSEEVLETVEEVKEEVVVDDKDQVVITTESCELTVVNDPVKAGCTVKIMNKEAKWTTGAVIPDWAFDSVFYVRVLRENSCIISISPRGPVTGGEIAYKDIAVV